MTRETIRTSITSSLFVNAVPLVAIALAVAVFIPQPPKSLALIVILLFVAISVRVSSWLLFRSSSYAFNEHDFSSHNIVLSLDVPDDLEEHQLQRQRQSNRRRSSLSNLSSRRSQHKPGRYVSSIMYFNTIQPLMRPSQPIIVICYSSILTLMLVFMIRLFSVHQFGGKPELLDYGTKVSSNGQTSDSNIAFEHFDFDTFAHFIQGTLCTLLSYPAVTGLISKCVTRVTNYFTLPKYVLSETRILRLKPSFISLCILQVLQSCMTIYPFYSMIKRLRYSSFSQTSHLNNCTEWLIGSFLGISLGALVSAWVQHRLQKITTSIADRVEVLTALSVQVEVDVEVKSDATDEESGSHNLNEPKNNTNSSNGNGSPLYEKKKETRYIFGTASEYEDVTDYPYVLQATELLSSIILILFATTVVLTGLFIGLSWNYDENYPVDLGMTILFVCIFIVNLGLFYFFSLLK